jgi:replicative DNA helicase Mcm
VKKVKFDDAVALQWNDFLYQNYYSNYQEAKLWDSSNDIFSTLEQKKNRIIVDFNAIQKFDDDNGTQLRKVLCDGYSRETLNFFEKELNFESVVDIEDPTKKYKYSLKKWNYPEPKTPTDPIPYLAEKIKLGFKNIPVKISIFETTNHKNWGKIVEVTGMIQNVGIPTVYTKQKTFECSKCHYEFEEQITIFQKKIKFNSWARCPNCSKDAKFEEVTSKEIKERIQLLILTEEQVSASLPIKLRIILPEDLIDVEDAEQRKLLLGRKIKISGILYSPKIKTEVERFPVVDALYWEVMEEEIQISKEDIEEFKKIANEDPIKKLVESFCPSIYGNENVKESIILSLVGGVSEENPIDKKFKRGNNHLLLIGSPSTAKTTLLMYIYRNFPRSKYLVASEMSSSGLSAGLIKDPETESWMISAGALVMANNSVCLIDELDKANPEDIRTLDVVAESCILPIDKIGISTKLKANTTIIACANPKMGRYDPHTDLQEQIPFGSVLLSRFDQKHLLQDIPNEELDKKISDRILNPEEVTPPIKQDILFKYLTYTKKLRPVLSQESKDKIKEYFIQMRIKTQGRADIIYATFRQLETLRRMTEAYAKLRMGKKTTKEDSLMAIKLYEKSLMTFGFDPITGEIDIDKAEGRPSSKTRNKYYRMLEIIKGLQANMKLVPETDFFSACSNEFTSTDVEQWLKQAKNEGLLIEPKPNMYEVV